MSPYLRPLTFAVICLSLLTHIINAQDKEDISHEAAVNAFIAALQDSKYEWSEDDGNMTTMATRLFGWQGCDEDQQKAIYSGCQQSYKIMNQVKGKVNWNEAAAVEYLGPPFENEPHQGMMQKSFDKVVTVREGGWWTWPGSKWIHARCDDPYKICTSCDKNGKKVRELFAYTTNKYDDSGYARINFCPLYFEIPTLDDIIAKNYKKSFPISVRANLTNFVRNQGRVWFHELLHIEWAASRNEATHIRDLWGYWSDEAGEPSRAKIYGPDMTKGLARYRYNPSHWLSVNSDNFAMYAMAKYMQHVTGKYPHLPLGTNLEDVSPIVQNDFFKIDQSGVTTFFDPENVDDCTTSSDQNGSQTPGWTNVVYFSSSDQFTKRSNYPEEYLTQFDGWWADAHPLHNRIRLVMMGTAAGPYWFTFPETADAPIDDFCKAEFVTRVLATGNETNPEFPTDIPAFDALDVTGCVYSGTTDKVGTLTCEGADNIFCYEDYDWGEMQTCDGAEYMLGIKCHW